MRPITTAEILNLYDYERVREARRRAVIELKRGRRVSVGRYLSFVFENHATVWFQIQEMVRAERIVDEARIAEEVEVYNSLLPRPGELAATMFIRRRIRSLPPGHRVATIVWSPSPAANASSGTVRWPE